jgi:predicted transcriptional regulator
MPRRVHLEPLGELELLVMTEVWSCSAATAREVCDRLTGARQRAYTTIMTTMDRLHRKGLLLREKDGLAWRYRPELDRPAFEKALAERLALKILRSHGEGALSAFVHATAEVDEALLDRLARLVAQRRRGTK